MNRRSLDFETRSACDLINEGAYRYAACTTTEAICCSWMAEGKIFSWWPPWVSRAIDESPDFHPILNADNSAYEGVYQAWNSQFDRLIWQFVCENDYGFPATEIEDWICTAALARGNGLPGALADAAKALQIANQKDARGKELIKLLSIPNGGTRYNPTFNEDPKLIREMIEYCEQDVRTEDSMAQTMRPFLTHELYEFWAAEHINDRGIALDIAFAAKAVTYSEMEMEVLKGKLVEVTKGAVETPKQYQKLKAWLLDGYVAEEDEDKKGPRYYPAEDCVNGIWTPAKVRISQEAVRQMTIYKGGERKISLDKNVRNNLMELYDEDPRIMTEEALELVKLTDLAGRSSTAKYKKMLQRETDGRLCGAYMFNGAKSTGRFSSIAVQIHNMVRDCVDDFDIALAGLDNQTDTEIIHTLARMMRPTIIAPPGRVLCWSDWSNVEGRGLPYLAASNRAVKKLELFHYLDEHPEEPDIYERMATRMGIRGDDPRQGGKVVELSFGFGGGVGACQAMSRNYGVRFTEVQAKDYQKQWRIANPWAEPFWYALKDAAWRAICSPMEMFEAGRVKYFYTPETHNGLGTLWCQLPSGRLLSYVYPKFEAVPCPWNEKQTMTELTCIKANFKPKAGETEWPRYKLWYGVLAENITQAFCADLLRDVITRAEDELLEMVGHTHDEPIIETNIEWADADGQKLVRLMETPPEWVTDFLPLVADIHTGLRYSK